MSQMPRWYREQILMRKLFTGDRWKDGLMDARDAANRREAVQRKLDQQDREYERLQQSKVRRHLRELEGEK